ncbi:DNA polymerase zeta processivity subunit [Naviculisporaceae sp. PSN 640]
MPPPVLGQPTTTTVDEAHVLLSSFNSFLTVAIHSILYYRNIYPQETFLTTRAYNLPVHQNRHPKVCSWINDAVSAVGEQIVSGNVARVAVVIHSPLREPPSQSQSQSDTPLSSTVPPGSVLERWSFDVSHFPSWPGGAKAFKTFERVIRNEAKREETRDRPGSAFITSSSSGVKWPDVDEQLRGALRRMTSAAEKLDALPEGCTFTVAVELGDEGVAPIGYPQAWIPSEPNLQPAGGNTDADEESGYGNAARQGKDLGGARTTPIRSVGAGPLYFECWLEEGKAKEVLAFSQAKAKGKGKTTYEDPP